MNRREAIATVGLLVGGTVIGAEAFLSGCTQRSRDEATQIGFSDDLVSLLDEVGETILPLTPSSPGAKAAGIGEFMKVIVTDCYEKNELDIFMKGIESLQKTAQLKYGKTFNALEANEKHHLLSAIDSDTNEYNRGKKDGDPTHYFAMIKQLTIWGYFTSKTGSELALRYLPVPGKYEGCIDYKKGDRAWSEI